MGGKSRSRKGKTGLALCVAALWILVVISLPVGGGGEAKTRVIARPLARLSPHLSPHQQPATGFLASPSCTTPPQQQHRNIDSGSARARSSSSRNVSARRALAWAHRGGISPSSVSMQPSGADCHQQARRPSLFQPDARLWLPPRHHNPNHYPTTMTGGRGLYAGGSGGGEHLLTRTLRGGGDPKTSVSALTAATTAAAVDSIGAAPGTGEEGVEIVKPERDERSYRYLVLPNGLAVVVVSDSYTETAAASMFIRCGHMQDPDELAGMAHFHEHSELFGARHTYRYDL